MGPFGIGTQVCLPVYPLHPSAEMLKPGMRGVAGVCTMWPTGETLLGQRRLRKVLAAAMMAPKSVVGTQKPPGVAGSSDDGRYHCRKWAAMLCFWRGKSPCCPET